MNMDTLYLTPSVVTPKLQFQNTFSVRNSHSVSHMLLIPIETLRYERDCLRKAREAHLIHKAKTIEPLGMNKHDKL